MPSQPVRLYQGDTTRASKELGVLWPVNNLVSYDQSTTWRFMPSQQLCVLRPVNNFVLYTQSTTWYFMTSQQLCVLCPVKNLVFYAQSTTWCFMPSEQLGVLCPGNDLVFYAQWTTWCFMPRQWLGVLCPGNGLVFYAQWTTWCFMPSQPVRLYEDDTRTATNKQQKPNVHRQQVPPTGSHGSAGFPPHPWPWWMSSPPPCVHRMARDWLLVPCHLWRESSLPAPAPVNQKESRGQIHLPPELKILTWEMLISLRKASRNRTALSSTSNSWH